MLRAYQDVAISDVREAMRAGFKRPLLQAPTGSGKTRMATEIIRSALDKGKRVLFVVDRILLIDQTAEAFHDAGFWFGVIQADHPQTCSAAPLQIGSVQTLTRRRFPIVDLIIVDEAHCVYAGFVKQIEAWNKIPVIGLSATPWTKGLGNIYDKLIVAETTSNLIDEGYLCDFVAYGPAGPDLKGARTTAGDYNLKDLEERVNQPKIIGDVVETWLKRGDNRQTVCFAVNVAHSEAIVDEFMANGVTAAHIDAYTEPEERLRIMAAHDAGEIKIISNVGIATKGWDSPATTCLIYARPTKSMMLHIQILGRVLRKSPCGQDAIILDHGDNIKRLGFPTDQLPEYLCNGEKEEKDKAKEKEKKEKLPRPCERCTFLSTEFICPSCGHKPEKTPDVIAEAGDLKKLARNTPQSDKDQWYGMLVGYARKKGFKDGWASHKYKEKFGVWPAKKNGVAAIEPNAEVANFIQHLNIKNSRKPSDGAKQRGLKEVEKLKLMFGTGESKCIKSEK